MPDKGPLEIGITDLNGEFKLSSGALSGCAVGPAKASVRVEAPGDSSTSSGIPGPGAGGDITEQSKKFAEMTMAAQKPGSETKKSLIPEKYRDPSNSGLTYTVDADGSKNKFKIELQD